MSYDPNNIFAKILRGEIPCNKHDECDHTLAFFDIAPQAETHILVITKGAYSDMADFSANASAEEQAAFINAIGRAAKLSEDPPLGFTVWEVWRSALRAATSSSVAVRAGKEEVEQRK